MPMTVTSTPIPNVVLIEFMASTLHYCDIGFHHVVDEHEVSALQAVPVHDGGSPFERRHTEARNDSGFTGEFLSWSIDIAVPQCHHIDASGIAEPSAVTLANPFRKPIRRHRIRWRGLRRGNLRGLAVDGSIRRTQYETSNTGLGRSGEHTDGAYDVAMCIAHRIGHRGTDINQGGCMEDDIRMEPLHDVPHGVRRPNVLVDKLDSPT